MTDPIHDPRLDGGSFRDREARVFVVEEADRSRRVLRVLGPRALAAWEALSETRFFVRGVAEGRIVGTRRVDLAPDQLDALRPHDSAPPWAGALEHDLVPFLSYPFEWPFGMLRDAALLQLDLLAAALDEGFVLKDASSYNVQWRGARPVFIDVASFEPWTPGDPWVAYLQFCQLFLYPLFLTAYRDVPFQPWLRGSLDGIAPEVCNRLLSWRDRFRPGVLKDVYLQAQLQAAEARRDHAGRRPSSLREELREAGFGKELIVANVGRLRGIVAGLSWRRRRSEWAAYAGDNTYDEESRRVKEGFVGRAAATRRWSLVWDLGCNTGTFSRIAAEHADLVVAVDADHLAVEQLYLDLRDRGPANVLPLVGNLADPSPALGWRLRERKSFVERERPDLVLCLALIHHLVITANVPLPELVAWLADLGAHLVIEFVHKDDAMVQKLLRNKDDVYHDYDRGVFERCLETYFEILDTTLLPGQTRTLYLARPTISRVRRSPPGSPPKSGRG